LFPEARVFADRPIQSGALVLQLILKLVDLVFLHPQLALEQLLAQVALATEAGQERREHEALDVAHRQATVA